MKKHGEARDGKRTPEYMAWEKMKQRCYYKNSPYYPRYGGRGIFVEERWKNSFPNFLKDMGRKPSENHSLGRIDNDKGYCKESCRWETQLEQQNNRCDNVLVTHEGVTKTVSTWNREFGFSDKQYDRLYKRLRKGFTLLEAKTFVLEVAP